MYVRVITVGSVGGGATVSVAHRLCGRGHRGPTEQSNHLRIIVPGTTQERLSSQSGEGQVNEIGLCSFDRVDKCV